MSVVVVGQSLDTTFTGGIVQLAIDLWNDLPVRYVLPVTPVILDVNTKSRMYWPCSRS